jgi:hypothetical protein
MGMKESGKEGKRIIKLELKKSLLRRICISSA